MSAIDAAIADAVATAIAPLVAEVRELRAAIGQSTARGLSPADYAAASGLSIASVYRRVADGTLPHRRVGARIVIPASAVEPTGADEIATMARKARG